MLASLVGYSCAADATDQSFRSYSARKYFINLVARRFGKRFVVVFCVLYPMLDPLLQCARAGLHALILGWRTAEVNGASRFLSGEKANRVIMESPVWPLLNTH